MARCVYFLLSVLAGLTTTIVFAQEARLWKDSTGTFQIEATLIKIAKETAYLRRKTDGKEIAVPLDKLSAADRDFLARRVATDPFASPEIAPNGVPKHAAGGSHGIVVVVMKKAAFEFIGPA